MKLRVARGAVGDLDTIWAYIAAKEGIEVAERLVSLLTRRFSFLAKNPGAGRNRPELRRDVRSFPSGNYRIYYRQETRGIVRILHVRHAAQDERKLFR